MIFNAVERSNQLSAERYPRPERLSKFMSYMLEFCEYKRMLYATTEESIENGNSYNASWTLSRRSQCHSSALLHTQEAKVKTFYKKLSI